MELEMRNLTKHYGKKEALKGVSVTLTPGIYGLLGPNGAGKSTWMNILTGNLRQTSGEIFLDGENISHLGRSYRRRLGYCPQQPTFYPSFTARRFLYYLASLQDMSREQAGERIEWALSAVALSDVANKPIGSFSGGMKQRLLIAQSLLHDPDILIMDEPTAGLDPRQRIAIRNLIGEIALHKIVMISTHVVQDVEYIAKELILLSQGEILRQATPPELLRELEGQLWEAVVPEAQLNEASAYGTVCGLFQKPEGICVRLLGEKPPIPCKPAEPNLEDVYLRYFGAGEGL